MGFFGFSLQHYSGLEEAVYRNISACNELAKTTRTAYGPHGKFEFLFFNHPHGKFEFLI